MVRAARNGAIFVNASSDQSAGVKNFQRISPESVLIMRVAHGLWSSSITLSDARRYAVRLFCDSWRALPPHSQPRSPALLFLTRHQSAFLLSREAATGVDVAFLRIAGGV
jgi:hypothetical protein